MSSDSQGIGLLGGSFDPVHNGHVSICRSYLNSKYVDRLFVVLTPEPPHKEDRELTAYSHRFKMLKLALGNFENLIISDIEQRLPKPSYTVNTVEHFKNKFPGHDLYLCIGEDSFLHFTNWYKWQQIIEKCMLLVAGRPNSGDRELPKKLRSQARFIKHEEVEISSSNIREKLRNGEKVNQYLPVKVRDYIKNHQLYRETK